MPVTSQETCSISQPAPVAEPPKGKSTGPRTAEGKQRSAQNSFKHGLYSKALVLPHECAAEFDELRAKLRAEHQPANTTEEILVDELAQHFWRLRRFRSLEATLWQPENLADSLDDKLLPLVQRSMASAERGFHKSLHSLRQLQKDRKFIPQTVPQTSSVAEIDEAGEFVPSFSRLPLNQWLSSEDDASETLDSETLWDPNDEEYQEFLAARERLCQFLPSKRTPCGSVRP
jgi:hypothetical protein